MPDPRAYGAGEIAGARGVGPETNEVRAPPDQPGSRAPAQGRTAFVEEADVERVALDAGRDGWFPYV